MSRTRTARKGQRILSALFGGWRNLGAAVKTCCFHWVTSQLQWSSIVLKWGLDWQQCHQYATRTSRAAHSHQTFYARAKWIRVTCSCVFLVEVESASTPLGPQARVVVLDFCCVGVDLVLLHDFTTLSTLVSDCTGCGFEWAMVSPKRHQFLLNILMVVRTIRRMNPWKPLSVDRPIERRWHTSFPNLVRSATSCRLLTAQ